MNIRYNFQEAQLDPNFGGNNLTKVKELIDSSISFITLAMPGIGVSYFLRYLATLDFAYFIHLDMYHLSQLTKSEFWKMFLRELGGNPTTKSDDALLTECEKLLRTLTQKQTKIVIIFNRFDQLKKEFDVTFLANIRSLRNINPDKIVMIFTANKPLYETFPKAISGANLNFYSKYLYFESYSKEDLKKLSLLSPNQLPEKKINQLIELAGGHGQLLNILMNSHIQENLTLDHFVKLQMKELLDFLNYHQKKLVEKVAFGKVPKQIDEYLLGIGLIKRVKGKFELFTPLLQEYIRTNLPMKLSSKESKLFKFLRKNAGRVVPKDEIFNAVWDNNPEGATDWALDALIYRLRKHPAFSSKFVIESHKKQGYSLIET